MYSYENDLSEKEMLNALLLSKLDEADMQDTVGEAKTRS